MNVYARPPSQRLNLLPHVLRDNIVMQSVLKRLGFRLRLFDDPRSVRAVVKL